MLRRSVRQVTVCVPIEGTQQQKQNTAGDILMRDFGEILKAVSRNYGFIGWNQGSFLGLFEQCSTDKLNLFLDMLEKRVTDYNDKQLELEIQYTVAYSNSTADGIYDIRNIIRKTNDRIYKR